MKTNTGCTIYNKYVAAGAEAYQRTVLVAVEWENRKAANVVRSGLLEADAVAVYVPFNLGTNYLKPVAWQALISKTGKWTLQVGDYIVKGLVLSDISSVFTISDLKQAYNDVVRITSVDTFDLGSSRMNHWQIGAK